MRKGFLFDIDGTVLVMKDGGEVVIDGAVELFKKLNSMSVPFAFVTNTTSKSPETIHRSLIEAGIEVAPEKVITPVTVAKRYLEHRGVKKIKIERCEAIADNFKEYQVSENPEVLILADDGSGMDYESVNRAFRHILCGAEAITLQRNKFYEKDGLLTADLGFYIAGFEYISGKKIRNLGKPSAEMFSLAAEILEIESFKNLVMIGDDIEFDILAPQRLGVSGILVKTGKYREGALDNFDEKPDNIATSIKEIADFVRK